MMPNEEITVTIVAVSFISVSSVPSVVKKCRSPFAVRCSPFAVLYRVYPWQKKSGLLILSAVIKLTDSWLWSVRGNPSERKLLV
jgi:hypothetical protein